MTSSLTLPASLADDSDPFLSARRMAESLGVTITEIAALAGVARNTLTGGRTTRKADAALSSLARILTMASEMAGSQQRAAIWFKHQPIPGWAGNTAYDLVLEGKADKVLAYLEAVRAGVYA